MAVTKAEYLARYKERINRARRWREKEQYDDLWRRLIELYQGKHFDPAVATDEDRIAVNIAFSTVNVIYPSVSVNFPKITVAANKPEDDDRSVITEAVLNYEWRHHNHHEPVRRAVKDYLILGHGWVKVGYRYVEAEEPMSAADLQQKHYELQQQADDFAVANPDMAAELPTDEEIAANVPDTDLVVVEDRPFVERISPFDMYVDPEATCMADAKWICQKIVKPLEEVKKDKRYRPVARKRIQADGSAENHDEGASRWKSGSKERDDIDRVTIYEFYDLLARTVSVCAEGYDDFLIEPRAMPYAFGHPFVMLRNYDVPDQFYPMGDLEAIEALQLELDKTRSQMMNMRKRYARKYLYYERAFDSNGLQALRSEDDNTMVPVANENVPLDQVIVPMPQEPMAPEAFNYSELIQVDIDKVSGVNEYARGAVPEVRRTATEASIIQDAINARSADKLAQIERSIGEVARRLVAVCQQFMTGDKVARVVGNDQAILWVPYKRDDLIGEFDFTVEAGSTQPMNETFRRQQAIAMMQSLGPLIGPVIDPFAIAKHVLQFGFGIKNPEKFMTPQGAMGLVPGGAPAGAGMPGMQPPPPNGDPMQQGEDGQQAVPGQGNIDPAILAQLAGQVGLTAPHAGG